MAAPQRPGRTWSNQQGLRLQSWPPRSAGVVMGEVGNAVAGYWNDTANGEWLLLPLPLELFGEPNLCSRWKAEGKKTSFMLHTRAVDLFATKCSRSFCVHQGFGEANCREVYEWLRGTQEPFTVPPIQSSWNWDCTVGTVAACLLCSHALPSAPFGCCRYSVLLKLPGQA